MINAIALISYFSYHLYFSKRATREYKGAKTEGSEILSTTTRKWWFWTTEPIIKACIKLHLGPNAITMMGVFVSCIAGVLFAFGSFGYAGWAMVLGASFDFMDGRIARMTGRCSRSGAFLDSVTDRFGEAVCFFGIAYHFRESPVFIAVIAAMIGSMLVSYTRARGEALGVNCSGGTMQRPERIAYLGTSAILDPIQQVAMGGWMENPPHLLIIFAVSLIGIFTLGTAIYRMIYIMNVLDTEDRREKDTIAQVITKLSTHKGREAFWEKTKYGYDRSKGDASCVILFHLGAVDADIFADLTKKGELPNISKYMPEGGYSAVAAFPSATGPVSVPLVTGCFPGTCNIPGVRWFDRNLPEGKVLTMNRFRDYLGWGAYAMDHDLSKSVRTIFEYSRQAANIFGMLNRGCGLMRDPAFFRMHSRFHSASDAAAIDEADLLAFHWFANALRRDTDFVLYSFPPMALAHGAGLSREASKDAYRKLDADVERAVELLKQKGMYEGSALFMTADFCIGEKKQCFDLTKFLSERFNEVSTIGGLKEWQRSDAISMSSGTSMSHVYIKSGDDWQKRTFFEDIERKGLAGSLIEKGPVDIIAGRSLNGGIIVQSLRGRAHIHEDADGRITYIVKGADPFGFGAVSQVLTSREAFDAAADSAYPDGIISMLQLFKSGRTGDLVISLAEGAYLAGNAVADPFNVASGSLHRSNTLVPLFSSVRLSQNIIRTADIFATIIDLMGIDPIHSMDGMAMPCVEMKS